MAAAPVPRKPAQRQRTEAQVFADSDRFSPIPLDLVESGAAAGMTRAELIIYIGVLARRYREDKLEVVITKAQMTEWTRESPREAQRAASHLAELGVLPRKRFGKDFAYGHCAARLERLKPRAVRMRTPQPLEAEVAVPEVPKRPAEQSFLPASLLCPLGAECPVDRVHTRPDGVLVNLPSPPAGANSGEAAPAFVSNQQVTSDKWTPVSTSGNGNGRREGETKWTPVSTLPDVHEVQVNEEKAKTDGAKWAALRDWMIHEGTRRGRVGVPPSEAEIERVYRELGAGSVAQLADYAAHKIHLMRRYNWLLPFARHVRRAVEAGGNGHGKAPPAVASEAELLRHEAASLLLQADPVNDDAPDYEDRKWRLAEFIRKHPDVVAAVRAELTA